MPLAGFPIDKRSALLLDKENMTKYSISPMSSLYELYLRHPRISTDSRRIEPDSVFFALRGASFDGNRFAADALDGGGFCKERTQKRGRHTPSWTIPRSRTPAPTRQTV